MITVRYWKRKEVTQQVWDNGSMKTVQSYVSNEEVFMFKAEDAYNISIEVDRVISLEAEGDCLGFIRGLFSGIPIANMNSCIWRNGMAKFIYENLNKYK